MKFKVFYSKFGDLLIFNKINLRLLEKKKSNLDLNIKYWIKTGKLINLKKGWYLFWEKYARESDKDFYIEFIANKLVEPSYLSGEYVLNKYGALTEAVSGIVSVSPKSGREIKNKLGVFRYYSISDELFCGYRIKKKNSKIIVFEAELAKALFDFLYIRFLKSRLINEKNIENLRVNWENIGAKDFNKSRGYLEKTQSRRLKTLYDIIENKYYAD